MNLPQLHISWGRVCPVKQIQALCLGLICCLLTCVGSVEALPVRVASFNMKFGVGDTNTAEYAAVRDILNRVNPDIIGFQELSNADYLNWVLLANELGYPYLAFGNGGTFAGSHRLGFFSRYPITAVDEVMEPEPAREITRWPLKVTVQVPGALNPFHVYTVHNKSSGDTASQFRRAVEITRLGDHIQAAMTENPLDTEFIVMGDFNEDVENSQKTSFDMEPSGLPVSYALGADILFPLSYALQPVDPFAALSMTPVTLLQEDTTNDGTFQSGSRLDYIFISDEMKNSPYGSPKGEVYNSIHDDGLGGLAKQGSALPSDTSSIASDHYCVFADVQLMDAIPCLSPVLLISEVLHNQSQPGASFVELFNTGTEPFALDGMRLRLTQAGGALSELSLVGTVGAGATHILAGEPSLYQAIHGAAPDQVFTNLSLIDGNDAFDLINDADVETDHFGVAGMATNATDFSMAWAYINQGAQREAGIHDPNPTFALSEWSFVSNAQSTPSAHVGCDAAEVLTGSPILTPFLPMPGDPVQFSVEVQANQPASNLVVTVYCDLNDDPQVPLSTTLNGDATWKTTFTDPGAEGGDVMTYSVEVQAEGPGGVITVYSETNQFTYLSAAASDTQILFNEVRPNDYSTDDAEFIELIAPAGKELGGYSIVHYNGSDGGDGAIWRYTFPAFNVPDDGVTDENGTAIGFVVLSGANAVVNSDFTDLYDLAGGGNIQNGPDGLVLYDPLGNVVDAIAWGGPGDLAGDDPGNLSTNVSSTAPNYLHVMSSDGSGDDSLQASNDVLGDTGANWTVLVDTPGSINGSQTSGSIILSMAAPALADSDEDGVEDSADNCPSTYNPAQGDMDADGIGDACDDDADGDSILDTWEHAAGLDPAADDASLDPDNDGLTNYAEYQADTDPLSEESCLRITNVHYDTATGNISVEFCSSPNRKYEIYYADNGVAGEGSWKKAGEGFMGAATSSTFIDTSAKEAPETSLRCYRVRVMVP